MTTVFTRHVLLACLLALYPLCSPELQAQQLAVNSSSADAAIPLTALIQPSELVQILQTSASEKPVILQIGSHVLYAEAHIPKSEYVGAAGESAGLQALRERVKRLDKNQQLVIYCGCCPWDHCPNIRPAYQELRALGFTRIKVLYLAENFGTDWVSKGYPVAKGR